MVHAFSSRRGGQSEGVFQSLNMGNPSRALYGGELDSEDHIQGNLAILKRAIGASDAGVAKSWLVHGAEVRHVSQEQLGEVNQWQVDGLMTDEKGILLAVTTADCLPILLADAEGQAVAAIHAGWRGLVAGVIAHAVKEMRQRYGVKRLVAGMGPCIGFNAFEVGAEVAGAFEEASLACFIRGDIRGDLGQNKYHVDLLGAGAYELERAGVQRVDRGMGDALCTYQNGEMFYSHRRERGQTGRLINLIGML